MEIFEFGLEMYIRALAHQSVAVQEVAAGRVERLLVMEHPPVITLGRNSGAEHLRITPETLTHQGIQVVQTSRGGSVTCHYPGQLVVYPILRLNHRPGGLRQLVSALEEAVIRALASYGLSATRSPGRPGIWIKERKIASIGLALKNWVTYHGLALNVNRDTSLFDLIRPCGLPGVRVTSVHGELDRDEPEISAMSGTLIRHLREVLA